MIIRELDPVSESVVRSLSLEHDKDAVVKGINAVLASLDEGKVTRAWNKIQAGLMKQFDITTDEAEMIRWVTGNNWTSPVININFSTVAQLDKLATKYKARV
jgi:hypothetical protein